MSHRIHSVVEVVSMLIDLERKGTLPPLPEVLRYTMFTLPPQFDCTTRALVIKTSFSPHIILQPLSNHSVYHTSAYFAIRRHDGDLNRLLYEGHVHFSGTWLMNKAINLIDSLSHCFYTNPGCFTPKFLTILGMGHYSLFDDKERMLLAQHRGRCEKIFAELCSSVKKNKKEDRRTHPGFRTPDIIQTRRTDKYRLLSTDYHSIAREERISTRPTVSKDMKYICNGYKTVSGLEDDLAFVSIEQVDGSLVASVLK